ncbi:MAG: hypothetical protein A2666_02260 [Parcubacteria group bacterium RIFCSPHIGHO2_01_FULL_47_10b]|nr:MAG: hypothetical protein A2666_02260 [Parcubacteria group bacterium RIFCSPHIGHO2_01_FULL_47_10b]
MKKIKVALVGLGDIAHAYEDNPNVVRRIRIPTHYAALRHDKRYELVAACDSKKSARDRFRRKVGRRVHMYGSLAQMLGHSTIDLLVIATPTPTHFSVGMEAMRAGVRAIFCEKPIAYSSKEARTLLRTAGDRNVKFGVNYFRSFDSHYVRLSETIRRGTWGQPKLINVKYSKGIFNTATHCSQLLTKFFGKGLSVRAFGEAPLKREYDPTISFIVSYETFDAVYEGLRTNAYRIFEIDMLFERGRLILSGDKLSVFEIATDHGFSFLSRSARFRIKIDISNSMRDVYDNFYQHLTRNEPLLCSNQDALHAVATAEQAVKSLINKRRVKI